MQREDEKNLQKLVVKQKEEEIERILVNIYYNSSKTKKLFKKRKY